MAHEPIRNKRTEKKKKPPASKKKNIFIDDLPAANKTMAIPELQKEEGFVREKSNKAGSFDKTTMIPELSREVIVDDEFTDDLGMCTTIAGDYTVTKMDLYRMWIKKWWIPLTLSLLSLIIIIWRVL